MSNELRDRVVEFSSLLGLQLSGGTVDRLDDYLRLLTTWNQRVRLTGSTDPSELWLRHVADCLAVAARIDPGEEFVDIGSGAGFPGVVIAISQPGIRGVLIEPRRRRASFLGEVIRLVGCAGSVAVECARAEEFTAAQPERRFDVAVSRAIRLEDFGRLAAPLLRSSGRAIGMDASGEVPLRLAGFGSPELATYDLPIGVRRRLLLYPRLC